MTLPLVIVSWINTNFKSAVRVTLPVIFYHTMHIDVPFDVKYLNNCLPFEFEQVGTLFQSLAKCKGRRHGKAFQIPSAITQF